MLTRVHDWTCVLEVAGPALEPAVVCCVLTTTLLTTQ